MEFAPPKTALYLWQARTFAAACLIYILLSFFGFPYAFSVFPLWGILVFAYLPMFFKGYKISVFEDKIEIKSGVIIKSRRAYRKENIIYLSKIVLPDAAAFDLCTVVLRGIRTRCITAEIKGTDATLLVGEADGE